MIKCILDKISPRELCIIAYSIELFLGGKDMNNFEDKNLDTENIEETVDNSEISESNHEKVTEVMTDIENDINNAAGDLTDIESDVYEYSNNNFTSSENIDIEDSDGLFEETKTEKNNKKYSYKKSIAVGLAGILIGGASMGYFLGIGLNSSNKIINGVSSVAEGNFSFSEAESQSDAVDAKPVNLVADENSISSTIASVQNAVVNISIKSQSVNFFNQVYESEGAGSGIIFKVDGDKVYIVTNNHVVDGASAVTISVTGTEQVSAKLVGKDSTADIAVISVSKKDMENSGIKNVTPAKFSNSDTTEVGESVIAIGNALGRGKTATLGIISAQNKEINIDGKNFTVIQTDAAINPGNSGGALVNTENEVIGINTAKLTSSSVEGTGYAIPSNIVVDIANQLIEKGSVNRAYLGISGMTISDEFRMMYGINARGVYIRNVEQNSSADKAGLQESDIITAVDGTNITSIDELSKVISAHKENDKIKISIIRNGTTPMEINAVLAGANSDF